MHSSFLSAFIMALLAAASPQERDVANAAEIGKDVAATQRVYDSIFSHLEPGGNLMMLMNVSGVLEGMVTRFSTVFTRQAKDGPVRQAAETLPGFMQAHGMFACEGFGFSLVPRPDGLNSVRAFVAREPSGMDQTVWRLMVGGVPRRCEALDFLPADTHLARVAVQEPAQLWTLFDGVISEFAPAESEQMIRAQLSGLEGAMGVSVKALLQSLGEEAFFAMMLDTENRIPLPAGPGETMKLPTPNLLLGVKVKSNELSQLIGRQLAQSGAPVEKSMYKEIGLRRVPGPMGLPVTLAPTFAVSDGFFLVGLNSEAVKAALDAKAERGPRLIDTAAYKRAFSGAPAKSNGMIYLSKTLEKEANQLLKQAITMGVGKEKSKSLIRLVSRFLKFHLSGTIVNKPEGILFTGATSADLPDLVASVAAIPFVALTGVAGRASLDSAREETHKHKKVIMDNLRLIDASRDRTMLSENLLSYKDVPLAKAEAFVDSGDFDEMNWPEGTVLLICGDGQAASVPAGVITEGRALPDSVWERFIRQQVLSVRFKAETISLR